MFSVEVKEKYTLYYDESNNMRVFSLREGKFNIDNDPNQKVTPVFVLGGIALREDQSELDFEALRESLRFPQELKFKSIAPLKASFSQHQALKFILGNRRISNILTWLTENDVAIHCFSVNTAFWSLLDIVEDLLCFSATPEELISQHYYKDCLYRLIKLDKPGFIGVLNRFGYPKIEKEQATPFLQALYELIQKNMADCLPLHIEDEDCNSDFTHMVRLGLLVYRRLELNADDLEFPLVHEIDEGILIGDFSFFYCHRISTFPNSKHVLDDEEKLEPIIDEKFTISKKYDELNYEFIASKGSFPIQVADTISGIFRVLLAYLESASLEDVKLFVKGLNIMEQKTFSKLKELLEGSVKKCGMFFHTVMVPADLEKYEVLFADQLRRHISPVIISKN